LGGMRSSVWTMEKREDCRASALRILPVSLGAAARNGGSRPTIARVSEDPLPLLAEIAVDVPGHDAFTWRVPEELATQALPGSCVTVPFGPRRLRGFIIALERKVPERALKDVIEVRAGVTVPAHLLRLIRWGARYYRCSVGEFLAGAVPAAVREGRKIRIDRSVVPVPGFVGELTAKQRAALGRLPAEALPYAAAIERAGCSRAIIDKLVQLGALSVAGDADIKEIRLQAGEERHAPTGEQRVAIDAVATHVAGPSHAAFLLYGVTGSGKTLVYLELAEQAIAAGRQVLFLLPEIALTPQLAARVRARIPRTAVWHSGFTDGERAALWAEVAAGGYDLVLGTRSALFAPLPAPGLIIVDEEHETSYRQENTPRYHARDLSLVYGKQLDVPVVLGSATPSCESVFNARPGDGSRARLRVLSLRARPRGGQLPDPIVVDMRHEYQSLGKRSELSRVLVERLQATVAAREQAIVLLNRRGWSPVVTCTVCGLTAQCAACDISLTFHRGAGQLKCHYCGHERPMPTVCPACSGKLSTSGLGTEQLEQLIRQAVPGCRTLRADADTVGGRQGHAKLLSAFANDSIDVLVGTQMVAKGLDFPRVTLVGVLCADRALATPDFRASERTYQLIAQVAGRAGRGARPGTVIVQAFDPEAPAIRCAVHNQPRTFYDAELALRSEYGYPPGAGLVRILWTGALEEQVRAAAEAAAQALFDAATPLGCVVLGPTPAAISWLKGQHRWHALIKAPSRGTAQLWLDQVLPLKRAAGVQALIDVDPVTTS
jgi:primosomal protein N' (replication factor Y) (superfamily II helicase)